MLGQEDFQNMTVELEHIIDTLNYNIKTIPIKSVLERMGFPINWKELAKIERSKDLNET